MARLVRVTLFAVALAVSTSMASAEQARHAHAASRANFRAQQGDPYSSSQPSEVTTAAPYTTTAAPYSSQPAEVTTTAAPYSSQPAEVTTAAPYATTTAAPYSSQPAEVTTTAAPTYTTTTAAPYSSQPAEVTTAAPTYTTAAPYSSQPAEVTTQAPYGSQPAEVTTQAPASSGSGCQWVYVDAQLVLSGASWANVQGNANAWSSLNGAITADVASLLGRSAADIAIQSITAANNALTVTFTARSNALAEAARIAALIRDDVPATAPLAATDGVYASVAGSSQDVSVASHTATSRDVFDGCGVSSSQPAEITTQAPYGSSQPAEVTTQAPSASSSGVGSDECQWVYIDAQLVLSGAGWANVRGNANAWSSLGGALTGDLSFLLGRERSQIAVKSMTTSGSALTVTFTVKSNALAEAARIAALIRDDVPATAPLSATDGVYASVGQSASDVNVASTSAASRDAFACTNAPSDANELTTTAPNGYGAGSGYAAPGAAYFPVYAALLLSGSGWQAIAEAAWVALKAALASDISNALHVGSGTIMINVMEASAAGLRVNYTVSTTTVEEAGQVSTEASQLDSSYQLPATSALYQKSNPSVKNANVTVSWASSAFYYSDSPAGSQASWLPWLASAAVVVAAAALVH